MVPYFNMLGSLMKNMFFDNSNGTLVINKNFSIHEIESIIKKLILNPEYLTTTTGNSNILCLSKRSSHNGLFLTFPGDQSPTQKLTPTSSRLPF